MSNKDTYKATDDLIKNVGKRFNEDRSTLGEIGRQSE